MCTFEYVLVKNLEEHKISVVFIQGRELLFLILYIYSLYIFVLEFLWFVL